MLYPSPHVLASAASSVFLWLRLVWARTEWGHIVDTLTLGICFYVLWLLAYAAMRFIKQVLWLSVLLVPLAAYVVQSSDMAAFRELASNEIRSRVFPQ